jgi:glyoxylase-like metal-dependent hydrolase (beta-lactamase superfamily II)
MKNTGGFDLVRRRYLVFLCACSLAGAQTVVRTGDPAKRGLKPEDLPRTVKIADNVYAYEGYHPGSDIFTTTNMFVVTSDGVLVADGQASPAETRGLIAAIAKVTPQPVRYVVVCSDHSDHTGGNSAFPAGVKWIVHPAAKAILDAQTSGWKLPADAEVVSDKKTIEMGGEEFQILFLGRGHTSGPLNVYLPKEKIAFLSEVFLNHLFPQFRTGYPGEYSRTLDKAEKLDARIFIPGHGFTEEADASREELHAFHVEVQYVVDEVTRLYKAGVPVEEAVKQVNWGPYSAWTGGGNPSPRIADMGPMAVRRVYAELSGQLN